MNNKGQTLVLFVVLLPIILLGFCFFVDTGFILYEKNHLEKLSRDVSYYLDKNYSNEVISDLILENDKLIKINITNEKLILEKEINSIFGQIIGIKKYPLKIEKEL